MNRNAETNTTNLESSLVTIAQEINEIHIKSEERAKATKGRFNLFTTLLNIGDETRLHSRFILFLLNSNETHDCGDLFLNLFIDTIAEDDTVLKDIEEAKRLLDIKEDKLLVANAEEPTDDGRRMDIYLKFENHTFAIENKIWARDQPNQIFDYAKHIQSSKDNNYLFYLTLDGKKSAESKDPENQKESNYFCISYENHIIKWLNKCLEKSYKYININLAIQQYKNVIEQLTNQTLEKAAMDEIKNIIINQSNILINRNEIIAGINDAAKEIIDDFFKELLTRFESKGIYEVERIDKGSYTYYLLNYASENQMRFRLGYTSNAKTVWILMEKEEPELTELKSLFKEFITGEGKNYEGGKPGGNAPIGSYHIYNNNFELDAAMIEAYKSDSQNVQADKAFDKCWTYINAVVKVFGKDL